METQLGAGRYRLVRELGRGGMGVVWLAEDQLVGRQVAVKELRPPPGLDSRGREVFGRRALQEARSAARIDHPGAVTLYDVLAAGVGDDAIYLIMELVRGPTLAEVIEHDGPLPEVMTAAFGLQLLSVLEAAHALGLVHRDIKPANIMIAAGGQAKLTDFGIAHTVGDARLTRSGVMGTQAYMAPELFDSAPITPAADLWSLGATLFAAVQGRGPFDRHTTGATLRAIVVDELPEPCCRGPLAAAISGMLQRDPACRATTSQARVHLQAAATQPAAETPVPQPVNRDQADAGSSRTHSQSTSAGRDHQWEQLPTTISPSSSPAPSGSPRSVVSERPDAGFLAFPNAKGRLRIAGAVVGLGVMLGLAGLFPRFYGTASLASVPYLLIRFLADIVAWAVAAAGLLRGGTMARFGALLGTGVAAVALGPLLAEVFIAISAGRSALGAGLVLSLLSWVACTAGSVYALTVRMTPGDRARPAPMSPEGALAVLLAVGMAVTLVPPWVRYTVVRSGISHTIFQGNFNGQWPLAAGAVEVMIVLIAVAIIAALQRPISNGDVLLAGAIVPMIAFSISTIVGVSDAASPGVAARETPAFWIYSVLLALLVASCVRMLSTHTRRMVASGRSLLG